MVYSRTAWVLVSLALLSWLALAQVNSLNTATLAAQNLVLNPSFEAALEPWVGTATRSTVNARDGALAVLNPNLSQTLKLEAGDYEIRAWGEVVGAARGRLQIGTAKLMWDRAGFREGVTRVRLPDGPVRLEVRGENGFLLDFVQLYRVAALEAVSTSPTGGSVSNSKGSVQQTTDAYRIGAGVPSTSLGTPTSREATQWMFSADSIWNTPIGANAVYVPSGLQAEKVFAFDQDLFFTALTTAPWRSLHAPGNWGKGRCGGANQNNFYGKLQLEDTVLVADATETPFQTPNNASAILQPDGRTLVQLEPMTRCERGSDKLFGYRATDQDIYGDGLWGGHFGSGLSSLGGTLRQGELIGEGNIRHALKIKVWAAKYLTFTRTDVTHPINGAGFRWPAIRSDAGAGTAGSFNAYGTQEPARSKPIKGMVMGALLAIAPNITLESLGFDKTQKLFPVIQKLFNALQNYGAYIDDNTGWAANYFGAEYGVQEELQKVYGQGLEDNPAILGEVNKLFTALSLVDNNAPNNIGGGGTRRAPSAPPFSQAAPIEASLPRESWKIDAFHTLDGSRTSFMTDGKADTAWRSGRGQGAFQDIVIDLGKPQSFNAVRVISGSIGTTTYHSWSRDTLFEVSNDRQVWTVVAGSAGAPTLELRFEPTSARYLRLTQTNRDAAEREWAIQDLQLLVKP